MDQTWIGLMGAALGAGSAVAGQVVTAIAAGRRDERRLSWEKTQATERLEQERRRLFVDERRDVFIRFISQCDEYADHIRLHDGASEEQRAKFSRPDLIRQAEEFRRRSLRLSVEMHLVAPAVVPLTGHVVAPLLAADPYGDSTQLLDEFETAYSKFMAAARANLEGVCCMDR